MEARPTPNRCPNCPGRAIKWGKDRAGNQRFRCRDCGATFADRPVRPLGNLRIDMDRAVLVLSLLTEGSSIRSAERITGHHRDTITRLLVFAGSKCESLLNRLVQGVEAKDVQADELWSFVGMKEKTKTRRKVNDSELGDAYTFIGIDRDTKLVLAHHVGRRTAEDTNRFALNLACATSGRFQLSVDGFNAYPAAVEAHFGARVDFAQVIKTFSGEGLDSERRYSPPSITGIEKIVVSGNPDEARICTSHVERTNLHVRMQMRRFTRLTTGFSRKRENLRAAVALHFAAYNFTWMHSSIRMTPAMKAGITRKPWNLREVLMAA